MVCDNCGYENYDEEDRQNEDCYDNWEEDELERRDEERAQCVCGAYQNTQRGFIQVADCCCGRT